MNATPILLGTLIAHFVKPGNYLVDRAESTDVVGDPVNVAARLQQEAHDGDVLIGESTRRLVSERITLTPFGVLTLKGRAETVAALGVRARSPAPAAAASDVVRVLRTTQGGPAVEPSRLVARSYWKRCAGAPMRHGR